MSKESQSVKEESSVNQLENLLVYGSSYADAKVDSMKASVRESVLNLSTQVSTILLGIMTLLVAVSFLMYGIAMGVGQFLGANTWLGFVIVGASVIFIKLLVSKIIHSQAIKASEKNNDILKHQADAAKLAFRETSSQLKQETSEIFNVKKWTEEYPFYATGAAAVTGFVIAGGICPPVKETTIVKVPSDESAFMTMLVGLAEDVLKEAVVPPVKEYIASFSKEKIEGADQTY